MRLYHAGFEKIKTPDIHHGRKNADFGWGFYLTKNEEFACRWARQRKDQDTWINTYELNLEELKVLTFERTAAWYDYIFSNRSGKEDSIDADVIIGPIANDTIYDTFGILTSGFLGREDAIRLLQIGPEYEQVVIKTQKAADRLLWTDARKLTQEELGKYQSVMAAEEKAYQEKISLALTTDEIRISAPPARE